ncbi:MAG: transketolase [Bdellovibrionales bacterium]|nr:transketolase [Bdellovibrionales bacterium]
MDDSIKTLPIKNALASTPSDDPKFSVEVQLSAGIKEKFSDPRAVRAMIALMDMQAVLGGAASHWGGPSAFAELMSATHGVMFSESQRSKKPWSELFNFVNDAGHCENGLYALKANYGFADLSLESLKGFRSIDSKLTGHGESHLFPEGVLLSNGPLGSALPQAQGLAYGDGVTDNERVTVVAISDGACMEGEVRESLAAIPGLASKEKLAPFILIISDNNTKLTGRMDDSYSMTPTFDSLKTLGWDVLHLERAHDLQSCVDFFEQALQRVRKNPARPVAIHARTIKGYGVKKTADSSSGGHGFPLSSPKDLKGFLEEIYEGQPVPEVFLQWQQELVELEEKKASAGSKTSPSVRRQKVQIGVFEALKKMREKGLPVFSISSDLPGSTGVGGFQKSYPDSFQDIGIMESNMVSMAAGMSKVGFIPVVDTFAQFGVTKGALPLIMASLSEVPLIGIFSHVGFQDAADGASHQALMYLSMTASIPNIRVCTLSCSDEAEALVTQAIEEFAELRKAGKTPPTTLFFLGRENYPTDFSEFGMERVHAKLDELTLYKKPKADSPKTVTVVASGTLVWEALKASEELKSQGVESFVFNASTVNRGSLNEVFSALEKSSGRLVTLEDHQVMGGMGSLLVHRLSEMATAKKVTWPMRVKSLGVQGKFGQSAYKASELYAKHGMDAKALVRAALELV